MNRDSLIHTQHTDTHYSGRVRQKRASGWENLVVPPPLWIQQCHKSFNEKNPRIDGRLFTSETRDVKRKEHHTEFSLSLSLTHSLFITNERTNERTLHTPWPSSSFNQRMKREARRSNIIEVERERFW